MHNQPQTSNTPHKRPITPQELAHKLLFDVPVRNWQNYDGMDRILTIAIRLAEAHCATDTISLLQQYGRADIIQEMKQLHSSLQLLASKGEDALSQTDKQALATSQQVMYAMVRQSLITLEANRPGKAFDASLLTPANDGYWQQRIAHMIQANEQTDTSSMHFGHYLLDVQRRLSLLCQILSIEEISAPQRH